MKLSKQGLKPEDATFLTNINVGKQLIDDLEKTVKEYGNIESTFGPKSAKAERAAAELKAKRLQLSIISQKIEDPQARITEGKTQMHMDNVIPMGYTVNTGTTLQALNNLRQTFNKYEQAKGAVSPIVGATDQQAFGSAPFQSPGAPGHQPPDIIQTRRLSNGQYVKVRQIGPGQYEKVD